MSTSVPESSKWEVVLIDAGDESGDCLIELPPELLAELNWKIGDTLETTLSANQILVEKKNE